MVVGQQDLTSPDPYEEIITVYRIKIFDRYDAGNQSNDLALIQVTLQNITSNKSPFKFVLLKILRTFLN